MLMDILRPLTKFTMLMSLCASVVMMVFYTGLLFVLTLLKDPLPFDLNDFLVMLWFSSMTFIFVFIGSLLPIIFFGVLNQTTLKKTTPIKRAMIYGFCAMVTTFLIVTYMLENDYSRKPEAFLDMVKYFTVPSLLCFYMWIRFAKRIFH